MKPKIKEVKIARKQDKWEEYRLVLIAIKATGETSFSGDYFNWNEVAEIERLLRLCIRILQNAGQGGVFPSAVKKSKYGYKFSKGVRIYKTWYSELEDLEKLLAVFQKAEERF